MWQITLRTKCTPVSNQKHPHRQLDRWVSFICLSNPIILYVSESFIGWTRSLGLIRMTGKDWLLKIPQNFEAFKLHNLSVSDTFAKIWYILFEIRRNSTRPWKGVNKRIQEWNSLPDYSKGDQKLPSGTEGKELKLLVFCVEHGNLCHSRGITVCCPAIEAVYLGGGVGK